jgi:hypothetical protein
MRRPGATGSADTLAIGLGCFSIGLGLAEVLAPRQLTRALGMRGQEAIVQTYGLREIANGIAILASEDRAPWLWGRVAGDALDVATLAGSFDEGNPQRRNVGIALAAVAGVAALDIYCAQQLSAGQEPQRPRRDYRNRSGFPKAAEAMRGAAKDFVLPPDLREPAAMRPQAGR